MNNFVRIVLISMISLITSSCSVRTNHRELDLRVIEYNYIKHEVRAVALNGRNVDYSFTLPEAYHGMKRGNLGITSSGFLYAVHNNSILITHISKRNSSEVVRSYKLNPNRILRQKSPYVYLSPNGQYLAYLKVVRKTIGGRYDVDMCIKHLERGVERVVARIDDFSDGADIFWSWNGENIYYNAVVNNDPYIFKVNLKSKKNESLVFGAIVMPCADSEEVFIYSKDRKLDKVQLQLYSPIRRKTLFVDLNYEFGSPISGYSDGTVLLSSLESNYSEIHLKVAQLGENSDSQVLYKYPLMSSWQLLGVVK